MDKNNTILYSRSIWLIYYYIDITLTRIHEYQQVQDTMA